MYKVIILDLDNTLIDFDLMEKACLEATLKNHGLPYDNQALQAYIAINHKLWQGLEKGLYDKKTILTARFEKWLNHYNLSGDPVRLNEDYLSGMADHLVFIDGAKEVLDFVQDKYQVVMMTNGVLSAQEKKVQKGHLAKYFDHIIISDQVGFHKPQVEIYDYMMTLIGPVAKEDILMVGDSLSSDIQGGINFGIDTCWFNKDKKDFNRKMATYEIVHLSQLIDILND